MRSKLSLITLILLPSIGIGATTTTSGVSSLRSLSPETKAQLSGGGVTAIVNPISDAQSWAPGQGVESETGSRRAKCLVDAGKTNSTAQEEASLSLDGTMTFQELVSNLTQSANLGVKLWEVVDFNAGGALVEMAREDDLSYSYIYNYRYGRVVPFELNPELNAGIAPVYKDLLERGDLQAFRDACGSHYVSQLHAGVSVNVVLKLKFATAESKQIASSNGSLGIVKPSITLTAGASSLNEMTKKGVTGSVHIRIHQTGGAPGEMLRVIGGDDFSCALTDVKICAQKLQALATYSNSVSDQIKVSTTGTLDLDKLYATKIDIRSYHPNIPNVPSLPSYVISPEAQAKRELLATKLKDYTKVYETAQQLIKLYQSKVQYEYNTIKKNELQVYFDNVVRPNYQLYATMASTCWSDPNQCLTTVAQLESALRADDATKLIIPNYILNSLLFGHAGYLWHTNGNGDYRKMYTNRHYQTTDNGPGYCRKSRSQLLLSLDPTAVAAALLYCKTFPKVRTHSTRIFPTDAAFSSLSAEEDGKIATMQEVATQPRYLSPTDAYAQRKWPNLHPFGCEVVNVTLSGRRKCATTWKGRECRIVGGGVQPTLICKRSGTEFFRKNCPSDTGTDTYNVVKCVLP